MDSVRNTVCASPDPNEAREQIKGLKQVRRLQVYRKVYAGSKMWQGESLAASADALEISYGSGSKSGDREQGKRNTYRNSTSLDSMRRRLCIAQGLRGLEPHEAKVSRAALRRLGQWQHCHGYSAVICTAAKPFVR